MIERESSITRRHCRRGGARRASTSTDFASTSRSNAITEAFAADLDEVRTIPDEAREAGQVQDDRGQASGSSFPPRSSSARTASGTGSGAGSRTRPTATRRSPAGAEPVDERPLEPLEAIERFGRCATRELEELTGRPRPVLEAELWRSRAMEAPAGRGAGRDVLGAA